MIWTPRSSNDVLISQARHAARALIQELSIVNPADIEIDDIAMDCGALVVEGELENADGCLVRHGENSVITVHYDIRETGKRRFTVAHELGHHLLHRDFGIFKQCDGSDMLVWEAGNRIIEYSANTFAVELLMPEDIYKPRCEMKKPSFGLIKELADTFQTTLTATAIRFTEFCEARCAMIYSTQNKINWVKRSTNFGYFIERGIELSSDSYAADFFMGKGLEDGFQLVPAVSWISSIKLKQAARLQEHSIAFPRYSGVLTLLWIDDDIDGFDDQDEEGSEHDPDYFTPDGKRWRW